jgi:hypothetical protein
MRFLFLTQIHPTYNASWIPKDNMAWLNIIYHYCTSTNDSASSNVNPFQYQRSSPDKDIIFDLDRCASGVSDPLSSLVRIKRMAIVVPDAGARADQDPFPDSDTLPGNNRSPCHTCVVSNFNVAVRGQRRKYSWVRHPPRITVKPAVD